MTVMYRKNRKWRAIHISVDLKHMETMEEEVEKVVKQSLEDNHLKRQWKTIDIVDVQVVSSVFQPTKDTTFIELLVFVADMTGEQID